MYILLFTSLCGHNNQKNVKPEYRCYFLASLADITYSLESGLLAEGRSQLISQIFTKSLSESHNGIQAISLSAVERLSIQNNIPITLIWTCLKHGNDLVKIIASRVLTWIDSQSNFNQLQFLLEHLDANSSPKIANNMLIILIEIVRSSKKDLPSVELPKIIKNC